MLISLEYAMRTYTRYLMSESLQGKCWRVRKEGKSGAVLLPTGNGPWSSLFLEAYLGTGEKS